MAFFGDLEIWVDEALPLAGDPGAYDTFRVIIAGRDNARSKAGDPIELEVLRPKGPVGPYRELTIALDVVSDLADAAYGSRRFDEQLDLLPEEVRASYRKYVADLRAASEWAWIIDRYMDAFDVVKYIRRLKPENETPSMSLHNARALLLESGYPARVEMCRPLRGRTGEYAVVAKWATEWKHTFTGFSWGKEGAGAQALYEFFQMLEMKPPIGLKDIELFTVARPWKKGRKGWDVEEPAPGCRLFIKGVNYGIEE